MSKRTIWLLISLMTIALVGISAFQVYWISNVIRLSEERFEKDALASLQQVVEHLERNEMVSVATNSFAFFSSSSESAPGKVRIEEKIQLSKKCENERKEEIKCYKTFFISTLTI